MITFHSIEDRIVKQAFRDSDVWELATKKPIAPSRPKSDSTRAAARPSCGV